MFINKYTLEAWLSQSNLTAVDFWAASIQVYTKIYHCKFHANNKFRGVGYSLPRPITQGNWGGKKIPLEFIQHRLILKNKSLFLPLPELL